jgi:hypothetical protein
MGAWRWPPHQPVRGNSGRHDQLRWGGMQAPRVTLQDRAACRTDNRNDHRGVIDLVVEPALLDRIGLRIPGDFPGAGCPRLRIRWRLSLVDRSQRQVRGLRLNDWTPFGFTFPFDASTPMRISEGTYQGLFYGSPLAYLLPLERLDAAGFGDLRGKRVADFGHGGIGQLRLFAEMGAEAVGIDVDTVQPVLYAEPGDQGPFGKVGESVKLVHGVPGRSQGRGRGRLRLRLVPLEEHAQDGLHPPGGHEVRRPLRKERAEWLRPEAQLRRQILLLPRLETR